MTQNITKLLIASRRGDETARDTVYRELYSQLRQRARHELLRRPAKTLGTTALVNESFLRLFDRGALELRDRNHFLALSVRAMRQILVDHYRGKNAAKRGGGRVAVSLDPDSLSDEERGELILCIDEALEDLAALDQRLARVVEFKIFLGFTEEEIAAALDVTSRTVRTDWRKARAWLARELAPPAP